MTVVVLLSGARTVYPVLRSTWLTVDRDEDGVAAGDEHGARRWMVLWCGLEVEEMGGPMLRDEVRNDGCVAGDRGARGAREGHARWEAVRKDSVLVAGVRMTRRASVRWLGWGGVRVRGGCGIYIYTCICICMYIYIHMYVYTLKMLFLGQVPVGKARRHLQQLNRAVEGIVGTGVNGKLVDSRDGKLINVLAACGSKP